MPKFTSTTLEISKNLNPCLNCMMTIVVTTERRQICSKRKRKSEAEMRKKKKSF